MSREELDALAEEVAERLGVDPETVMTEPPNRLSLTIKQVRSLMALAPAGKLLVLTIDHDHGSEVSIHRSNESVKGDLIAWVNESWERDGPGGERPDDSDEAIKAYFDFAVDECYTISEAATGRLMA